MFDPPFCDNFALHGGSAGGGGGISDGGSKKSATVGGSSSSDSKSSVYSLVVVGQNPFVAVYDNIEQAKQNHKTRSKIMKTKSELNQKVSAGDGGALLET